MGYYTDHELQIIPDNEELYTEFVEYTGYIEDDSTKWYARDADCKRLSSENLGYLIVVTGKGEDSGDVWKKAFLNGDLVWEWRLENNIPDVPKSITDNALLEFKKHQAPRATAKIKELESEIEHLKSLTE